MTTTERDANGLPLPVTDLAAEGFVLGAAMTSPQGLTHARHLSIEDFTPGKYREVFEAILDLDNKREPVSLHTVQAELERRGVPGGHGLFVAELYRCAVPDEGAGVFMDRVEHAGRQRRLLQLAQEYLQLLAPNDADPGLELRLEAVVAEMGALLDGRAKPDRARRVFDREVSAETRKLRVRDEARRALAAELRGTVDPPAIASLRDRLARPRPPQRWRISDWQPVGARVMLAAQFKAGKTSVVGNLARCLVDGDLWLGRHEIAPVDGTVVIIDFEMSDHQLDDWLRDQGIRHDDRIIVVPMRGRAAAFDILDPRVLAEWAARLRDCGAAYVVLDCLRPILDALGLDEHRDAGRFLVALDALLAAAGVDDATVVHHMGHSSERSRGDSRIRDWPDVEWRLVRQDDDPASQRYISAYGRDVDIPETQLAYDTATRHLTLAGGSRKDASARVALPAILAVLDEASEPLSGRNIEAELTETEHSRQAIRQALALGIRLGMIKTKPGPRRSTLHSRIPSVPVRQSAPPVRQRSVSECASALIDGALTDEVNQSSSAPVGEDDTRGAA